MRAGPADFSPFSFFPPFLLPSVDKTVRTTFAVYSILVLESTRGGVGAFAKHSCSCVKKRLGRELDGWRVELAAAGLGMAGRVIGQSEREHDGQPEEARSDDELGAARTIFAMHEKENDQCHLDRGNHQREDDIPTTQVDFSGLDSQIGAEEKSGEH